MSHRDRSNTPDYCSAAGAEALIARIKAFWASKGAPPPLVQPINAVGDYTATSELMRTRVDIRSDMRNGWPVAARGAD